MLFFPAENWYGWNFTHFVWPEVHFKLKLKINNIYKCWTWTKVIPRLIWAWKLFHEEGQECFVSVNVLWLFEDLEFFVGI